MVFSKRKKHTKNKEYSQTIIVGIFFIFLGVSALIYNHYNNKKMEQFNNQQIEEFFEKEKEEEISLNESEEITEKKQESPILEKVVNYIAVLEIPKISLKRGLVEKTSPQNNINENICILKETTLPDEQMDSHILLAAHAGNSYISFFRNLKKLEMKDKIYFYYKGMKYIYEVSGRYEIEKTGTAKIRKTNTSDITLITCVSGTNKQVVYVAELVDKTNY